MRHGLDNMKKTLKWVHTNALFLLTLFLLVFVPLYPKLPLVDVKNTWVYIRAEDFIVFLVLLVYGYFLIRKKVTLKTPLTIPILAFWILGGLATIHGVLFFFPTIANVFPNVALLSYIRHIEYMSVFFVAFAGLRQIEFLKYFIIVLSVVFIAACLYGLGQKYASLPAFLTMNEEFAKGVPITLSSLSRVPSTFAGHYDFAAYLALVIPLFAALFFGVRNIFIKAFFAGSILLGLLLMFMTVSRVSFFAVLVGIAVVLFILKRKLILLSLPLILILGILVTFTQSSLFARFGNTVREVDVLVNGKTGAAVGNVEYVPVSYLYEKNVKLQRIDDDEKLNQALEGEVQEASVSAIVTSLLLPYELLPADTLVPLVKASNISNGETLPQGTGYINLSLSPVKNRVGDFYYELSPNISTTDVINFHGNFLVKTASAYDLSFTTRFQGEWPNALYAFMRNIFFGSGYGSVSLAIDNNFLRMLAEVGLLGTGAFILLLIIVGIYAYKTYKFIDSKLTKTFVVGICAGIIALSLNATLIDVFEASKVAFLLWALIGITLAIITLESTKKLSLKSELERFAISPFAMVMYLAAFSLFLYTTILNQFFTLRDFNIFYHSIACGKSYECLSANSMLGYFMGAPSVEPPLVTLYFSLMYKFFWLNQVVYHISSILLNFGMALLVFVFAQKLFKKTMLSASAGFIFLISASTFQSTTSIADVGVVASSLFAMLSILLYTLWREKQNVYAIIFAVISGFVSLLFGPLGIVVPIIILFYELLIQKNKLKVLSALSFWILSLPTLVFSVMRIFDSFSPITFLTAPWTLLINVIGSIPGVVLGENMHSFVQRMYSMSNGMQVVLSLVVIVLGAACVYLYNKKKLYRFTYAPLVAFLLVVFVIGQVAFGFNKDVFSQSTYFSIIPWSVLLSLIFYWIYVYIRQNDRYIAVGFVTVGIITYSLFQIIQIQTFYKNNHTAGESVKKFLTSIDSYYSNQWAQGEINFYFINTPSDFLQTAKSQSSLESVLWFVFQNPELKIHIAKNADTARQEANRNANSYIFMFNDDGEVSEIPKFIQNEQ